MLTKKCTRKEHVGEYELPIEDFVKNSKSEDGYSSLCKKCKSELGRIDRERVKQNPERKQKFLDDRKRDRERGGKVRQLYYAAMGRAYKKGLEFNIERSDVIIPEVCPVLGIIIKAGKGKKGDPASGGGNRDSSPSIDRIDNSKGYIKGNIRVISWRANYLKNTATLDELVLLGEDAKIQIGE